MLKFDKRVKPGTKVLVKGWGWYTVKAVHQTRQWIEIDGLMGSFPRGHVLKFTNKIRGFGRVIKLVTDKKEN